MCSVIKAVLKSFTNFTGKYLCWILFLKFCSTFANDWFCISKIQSTNNVIYTLAENFIFKTLFSVFGFTKYFFSWPGLQTLPLPNLCFFLHFSRILFPTFLLTFLMLCSPASSQNWLNAFSHCQKFVLTDNALNQWVQALVIDRDKHYITASLTKTFPLKVGVYVILEIHYTLFTDPI